MHNRWTRNLSTLAGRSGGRSIVGGTACRDGGWGVVPIAWVHLGRAVRGGAVGTDNADDAGPCADRSRDCGTTGVERGACRCDGAIPPVLRRKVLHRAGWRCEVPECRNRLWLDVHHTEPWADAERHEFDKLLVLRSSHHRAVYLGYLAVEVRPDGRVAVAHGVGRRLVGGVRGLPSVVVARQVGENVDRVA